MKNVSNLCRNLGPYHMITNIIHYFVCLIMMLCRFMLVHLKNPYDRSNRAFVLIVVAHVGWGWCVWLFPFRQGRLCVCFFLKQLLWRSGETIISKTVDWNKTASEPNTTRVKLKYINIWIHIHIKVNSLPGCWCVLYVIAVTFCCWYHLIPV